MVHLYLKKEKKKFHLHGLSFTCTLKVRKTNRSNKSAEKDQNNTENVF